MLRQCIRENKPFPAFIADAPDIEPESMLYYYAFIDLGSCRNYEAGEIPWTAIREYADEYELDEDQRVIMFHVIRSVDIWFLEEMEKKAEANRGRDTNRGHGGGRKKVLPIGQRR